VIDDSEKVYLARVEPLLAGEMIVVFPDKAVRVTSALVGALVRTGDVEVLADGRAYFTVRGAVNVRKIGEPYEGPTVWEYPAE
jgi:hypothetical protein